MAFRLKAQLVPELRDSGLAEAFVGAYAMKEFINHSVIPNEYQAPEVLADAIILSAIGEEIEESASAEVPSVPTADRKLALLAAFSWDDLLIDLGSTDMVGLQLALSEEYRTERLRLVWPFGRRLYDRFADLAYGQAPSLDYAKTNELIDGTGQGVAQLARLVVGPLGILESH